MSDWFQDGPGFDSADLHRLISLQQQAKAVDQQKKILEALNNQKGEHKPPTSEAEEAHRSFKKARKRQRNAEREEAERMTRRIVQEDSDVTPPDLQERLRQHHIYVSVPQAATLLAQMRRSAAGGTKDKSAAGALVIALIVFALLAYIAQ